MAKLPGMHGDVHFGEDSEKDELPDWRKADMKDYENEDKKHSKDHHKAMKAITGFTSDEIFGKEERKAK